MRSAWVILTALAAAATAGANPSLQGNDAWPMWRHGLNRLAFTSMKGAISKSTLTVKWKVDLGGLPEGSAVVGDLDLDGKPDVCVTTYQWIAVLKGETGELIWKKEQKGDFNIGTAGIADLNNDGKPEVVHGRTDGLILCRNGQTGDVLWQVDTGSKVWSSPAIVDADGDGGLDVVIASEQKLYVLRGSDGSEIWSASASLNMFSSPAVGDLDGDGDLDVFQGGGFQSQAFQLSDGTKLWSVSKRSSEATPFIADIDGDGEVEVVYSDDGKECGALDGKTGNVEWTFPFSNRTQGLHCSPAGADVDGDGIMEVFAGSADGKVFAINGKTGQKIWEFDHNDAGNFSDFIESSISVGDVDGDGDLEILFGTHNRKMFCLDAATGVEEWRHAAAPGGEGKVVATPTLADIDQDGLLEIIVQGNGGGTRCLDSNDAPPAVQITKPADGAEVSGKVQIAATATDDKGVARVEFRVGNTTVGTDSSAPYETTWDTQNFSAGSYTITALATDTTGQTASDSITVTLKKVRGGLVGPWPIWQKDLRNTSFQPIPGRISSDPTLVYKAAVGLGESTPAVGDVDGDGKLEIVAFAYNSDMTCLDAKTGAQKWQTRLGERGINISSVTLADLLGDGSVEALVVNQKEARLYVVNAADGTIKWTRDTGGDGMSTAYVADVNGDGVAEVVVGGSKVQCIKPDGSGILWENGTGGSHQAPAIADVDGDGEIEVVVGTYFSGVAVIDGKSGRTEWSGGATGGVASAPAVADLDGDGVMDIVTADASNGVFRINGKTGQVIWRYDWGKTSIGFMNSPALGDLNGDGVLDVVAGSGKDDHKIYGIDGATGKKIWSFQAGSWLEPSPVICDIDNDGQAEVLYRSYDGFTYCLDGRTGAEEWKHKMLDKSGNVACAPILVDVDGDGFVEWIQQEGGSVRYYAPDRQAPNVSITQPANNETVSGTVTVKATVSSSAGIQQVDFLVDGSVEQTRTSGPWEFTWDTTQASDGSHTLSVTAVDSNGLSGSDTITVKVNNGGSDTPPQVSWSSPQDGDTVSGDVALQVTAVDDRGVTRVEFFVDGTSIGTDTSPPYELTWSSASVSNGSHTLSAMATDTAGQTGQAQIRVTVSNSSADSPPSVSITSPSDQATVSGTITIQATASDDKGVTRVRFLVDGTLLAEQTSAPYAVTWDTKSVADGNHTLEAIAFDTAGQSASHAITVGVLNNASQTKSFTTPAEASGHAWEGDGRFYSTKEIRAGTDGGGNLLIGMILFDLSGLPGGVTVTELKLSLTGAQSGWFIPSGTTWVVERMPDSIATNWNAINFTKAKDTAAVAAFTPTLSKSDLDRDRENILTLNSPGPLGGKLAIRILGPSTSGYSTFGWHSATADNPAKRPTLTVTYVDQAPPTVSIDSPTGGATVSGTVTIRASASTPQGRIDRVEFLVDGVTIGTATAAPYEASWDTTTVPDGVHTITARATASTGLTAEASIQVTTDNVDAPPVVSITSPSDGAVVAGTVAVSADASDDKGVARVRFFLDGGLIGEDTTAPYSVSWNTATVADGRHTLQAVAVDTAGQTGSHSISVTVQNTQDTPPTVSFTAPSNGTTVSGTLTLRAAASDDNGVSRVEFFVDGASIGTDTAAPFETTWDSTSVPDGSHTITAVATDTAGQTGQDSVTIVVDNQDSPPSVSLTSPSGGATVSGNAVSITATATDDVSVSQVEFFVDGTSIAVDTAPPYSATWDSTSVPDGSHTITAVATDSAGQTGRASITVTVDNTDNPPTVSIIRPKDKDTVSGTITLEANASDDQGVSGVEFYVDGSLFTTDTTPPYRVSWDTTSVVDGSHTIQARAIDSAGQTATDAVTVFVQNQAQEKTITITAASTGHAWERDGKFYVNTGEFRSGKDSNDDLLLGLILFDLSTLPDNVTIKQLKLEITGAWSGWLLAAESEWTGHLMPDPIADSWDRLDFATVQSAASAGTFSPKLTPSDVGKGRTNTLTLQAPSGAGSPVNKKLAIRITPVRTSGYSVYSWHGSGASAANDRPRLTVTYLDLPPNVVITSPADGQNVMMGLANAAALGKGPVKVTADAWDDIGVTRVDLFVNGKRLAQLTEKPYEALWDTAGLPNGTYVIKAIATDTAGQRAVSIVRVKISDDKTPPNVKIAAPQAGAVLRGVAIVSAQAADDTRVAGVSLFVDGALVQTITSGLLDFTLDTTRLSDGTHTLKVVARDDAGNQAQDSITVLVANTSAGAPGPGGGNTGGLPSRGGIGRPGAGIRGGAGRGVGVRRGGIRGGRKGGMRTGGKIKIRWRIRIGGHSGCRR